MQRDSLDFKSMSVEKLFTKLHETDGKIKGIVMDGELGGPLEFVTVQVKAKGSDKIVQGSVTGSDGNYTIGGLKKGEYVVTFSYIGYEEVSKNISISSDNQILSLGELTLAEDANQLGEVEVVAKRPQMRFEIDRKVFDATQDIAAEGGSASDLLSNIPSVEVDNEGSVSLRGNSSVTIWINGKASGLTADNQADILDMMPAGDIKQVEVITNPSARYSPEGKTSEPVIMLSFGVVGLVEKTVVRRIQTTCDASSFKLTVTVIQISISIHFTTAVINVATRLIPTIRIGSDFHASVITGFHITKSDDLAFNVTGMTGGGDNSENIHYNSIDSQKNTIYTSDRITNGDSDMKMYNLELNYVHKFSENSNIDLMVSNNQWRRDGMNIFRQSTVYTDPSQIANPLYQTQENDIKDKTWEVQADYTNKISDMARIEAGYKGTFQRNASPVDTYTGTTAEDIRQDESLYNRFLYQTSRKLYR